jgi:mycothiol synthase
MIEIKDVPPIPGLRFRNFQGESDAAQIAAVLNASQAADNVERNVSAEDILNAYQHLHNCTPGDDIIIAEVAGKIVGYARGWWESDINSGRICHHNGFLVPEWRRKGIGHAMLLWMENHLSGVVNSHPGNTRCFQVNVTQYQEGTAMMLQRAGYQSIRCFYEMVRPTLDDIVDFSLPAGLEFRPVIPAHYQALWQSIDETSKDEWGYSEPTEEDQEEWLRSPHFQPDLWQVAWDSINDRIVGHALTFIDEAENKQLDRKRGYTEGIGVDSNWRRRGVARALISRSLQAQKAAGMTESALAADSDSTSKVISLYESCGFQIVKCDSIYRKQF